MTNNRHFQSPPSPQLSLPYVTAALRAETDRVAHAGPGGRANQLFRSAAALGRLVGSPHLGAEAAHAALLAAALASGLSETEARGHLRRGLGLGMNTPVSRFDSAERLAYPVPASPPGFKRPPRHEVDALWDAAREVGSCRAAVTLLAARGLDAEMVDLFDLARVLGPDTDLPPWARGPQGAWTRTGHRLLFQMWDFSGDPVSLRARSLYPGEKRLKSLAPGGYQLGGLVLADPHAVGLLREEPATGSDAPTVIICEGEPDFLTWACRGPQASGDEAAILGVVSGAWTKDLASRIPNGARVAVRTHLDEAGERYAERITSTLADRCQLHRLAGTANRE